MATSDIFNLTDTWNAGATTFTAIRMNVTDTASASGSLLMDLQVGGSSRFSVSKAGVANVQDVFAASGVYAPTVIQITSSAGRFDIGGDVYLTRAAAASLRLGAADAAAPVAQTLGVQSVIAGTTNTAGTNFTIKGSAGTGTGAGGSIIFQVAPAGSTGTAQNAFSTALTVDSTKTVLLANNTTSSPGIQFAVNGGFYSSIYGSQYAIELGIASAVGGAFSSTYGTLKYAVNLKDLTLGSGSSASATISVDAANTLALRNGTSAQTFNIYGTYTDASNYERVSVTYSGGLYSLSSNALGTGVARPIGLVVGASLGVANSGTASFTWTVTSSGNFITNADNTYDIGASGATRPRDFFGGRDMYFGRNLIPTATFATNQTTGFINIPGAAGAPSGVPSNTTGFPLYYDSTNNKIYVYNGSWRSTAALT